LPGRLPCGKPPEISALTERKGKAREREREREGERGRERERERERERCRRAEMRRAARAARVETRGEKVYAVYYSND